MALNAEVAGGKPTPLEGELTVKYTAGLIVLFPATRPSADALITIMKEHPKAPLTLESIEDDAKDKLTVLGVKATKFFVSGTQRVLVMDPVAE
jgi:hypothetical protein